jgi:hypothetical protein
MADAYILETEHETAGIVVAEPGGLRFYAAAPGFNRIDGILYRSLKAARAAVDDLTRVGSRAGQGWRRAA